MKLIKTVILSLALLISFASCNKDNRDSYTSIADMVKSGNEFYFILDDGSLLKTDQAFNLQDGQRVILRYYLESQQSGVSPELYHIDVFDISLVLSKPVLLIDTEEKNTDAGNDPVNLYDYWVSGKYLNLTFLFLGGGTTHLINLADNALDPSKDPSKTLLELRHNAYGDRYDVLLRGFVSFDISSLIPDGASEYSFTVRVNKDLDGNQREYVIKVKNSGNGSFYIPSDQSSLDSNIK